MAGLVPAMGVLSGTSARRWCRMRAGPASY